MTTNYEMIGREDINDLEAILSISNSDVDEIVHTVRAESDALFTWDYSRSRPALIKLYEKAKTSQWNATTDLDWSLPVDQAEQVLANAQANVNGPFSGGLDLKGTPFESWTDDQWIQLGIEGQNWTLSQFLHGEQGALICTAQIVETVPWIDAKYYAATQVMDEARHVEVFARYLNEKLSGHYPINAHLKMLLDDIIMDTRWDMTYLGMQIMVEGLALAAFGFIHQLTTEPLLKKLLRYVMSDEARHVAFGVLSLQELYDGMTQAELRERQEFAYEAVLRLRDRWFHTDTWQRLGVDPRPLVRVMIDEQSDEERMFRTMLFSKIVPNCKKLGLLDAGDGWLRQKFGELGILVFEDWVDTGDEYEDLVEVSKDRDAASA